MKIRRFYGKDMRETLNQVKEELGGEAVIMSNKKVADGVEIVAAYDNEPVNKKKTPTPNSLSTSKSSVKDIAKPKSMSKPTPSLSEIIGDSGPDSLRELLDKQSAGQDIKADIPKVKKDMNVTASNKNEIGELRDELNSLRNVLEYQVTGLMKQNMHRAHPLQCYLTDRLEQMGISSPLAEELVSYTPENTNEREAWLFLLKLLANRLKTTRNDILREGGIVALMGPTGTGKTTTIAKLAAQFAQKYGSNQVALVTTDSYRIAAFEQLATYGKIIGCPVKKAVTTEELSDVLYQLRSKKLILIDTAGFGQRDSRLINQLDTLNQTSCAKIKKYLVMQANAQRQVMERTLNAYRSVALQGCIFTKLDECYSLGEVVSVAIQHKLPVSYVTDGQKVPEDLKSAEAKSLISAAAKLYKKYGFTHTTLQQVVQANDVV